MSSSSSQESEDGMEGDGEWFLIHLDEVFGYKLRPCISNTGFLSDFFFFLLFSGGVPRSGFLYHSDSEHGCFGSFLEGDRLSTLQLLKRTTCQ